MAPWFAHHQVKIPDNQTIPKFPKTVRLKVSEDHRQIFSNWLWILRNFAGGVDPNEKASCVGKNAMEAAYIAQQLRLMHVTDDFKPYGRTRIESGILMRLCYLIDKLSFTSRLACKLVKESYPYQLGLVFRGLTQDQIICAAIHLAYNGTKMTKDELQTGEETLKIINQRVARFKKRFKIA